MLFAIIYTVFYNRNVASRPPIKSDVIKRVRCKVTVYTMVYVYAIYVISNTEQYPFYEKTQCWMCPIRSPHNRNVLYNLIARYRLSYYKSSSQWLNTQPPPRYPNGIVLASIAGSIPSQGPRHTKDVMKTVAVVPLVSTEHSKGKILALSQELR